MLKFNVHCHSSPVSPCGQVSPARVAETYAAAGYDGIVLTNHYSAFCFERFEGAGDAEKVDWFLRDYEQCRARGAELGLDVLLGAELNLSRYNRAGDHYPVYEFLLFGLTESFLRANPRMFEWSQQAAYERLDAAGILMIQAHPFRVKSRVADPFYEHGIEVVNGHPGHFSYNGLARGFADAHPRLLRTAGDDFHAPATFGYAGMLFPDGTKTAADLANAIREGRAELFETGKVDASIKRK